LKKRKGKNKILFQKLILAFIIALFTSCGGDQDDKINKLEKKFDKLENKKENKLDELHSDRRLLVKVTFNDLRNKEQFAGTIANQIEVDSADLIAYITDTSFLNSNGFTTENIVCLFIPNTYEIYWNTSVKQFVERMQKEYETFWSADRKTRAKEIELTPFEIMTLASIVEKEQSRRIEERPMIAGLYLNRIKQRIKLQSDPTIIFANNDFSIRRVLNKHLKFESPYNTYIYFGLPPGPICIPSRNAIDAVLNAEQHEYIFMCAKGDASGLHNFAITNREHINNRNQYKKNLNFN
tara:strand:+ start:38 stop:922 length:885 start_codon:yes stop_codon:yes gene_type:complete